jgi:hypothetical protein
MPLYTLATAHTHTRPTYILTTVRPPTRTKHAQVFTRTFEGEQKPLVEAANNVVMCFCSIP